MDIEHGEQLVTGGVMLVGTDDAGERVMRLIYRDTTGGWNDTGEMTKDDAMEWFSKQTEMQIDSGQTSRGDVIAMMERMKEKYPEGGDADVDNDD
jgi:hypothetical protein